MNKHTPGPWSAKHWTAKVYDKTKHGKEFFKHKDWFDITAKDVRVVSNIKNENDAKLIAAAPELLNELKNLFVNYRIDSLSSQDNDRIGALLKSLGAL